MTKVNNNHGPFAMLLCVGEFFGTTDPTQQLAPYVNHEKKIPLPTYFITGHENKAVSSFISDLPNGGDICENLTYLGRNGIIELAGLKIGFLSGVYNREVSRSKAPLVKNTVQSLLHFFFLCLLLFFKLS